VPGPRAGWFFGFFLKIQRLGGIWHNLCTSYGYQAFKEMAMETQAGNQRTTPRLRILTGGRSHGGDADGVQFNDADIVCLYGVEVQRTSVAGLELVEFEFLPDAA